MTMPTPRKSVAVLCIALAVFTVFVTVASHDLVAVLTLVWAEFQPESVQVLRGDLRRDDEQPLSLLSLASSRAPPPDHTLA
jgi:hypothetical protein